MLYSAIVERELDIRSVLNQMKDVTERSKREREREREKERERDKRCYIHI